MSGGTGQRGSPFDWTLSPAKWGAVGVLALLGACGLAWSVIRAEGGGRGAVDGAWRDSPTRPATLMGDGLSVSEDVVAAGEAEGADDAGMRDDSRDVEAAAPTNAAPSGEAGTGAVGPGVQPAEPAQPVQPEPTIARRIDINTASEAELQLLPGIGAARARAIIEDRRARGRFRSVDDLDRVQGIGAGIIAGLREFARAG